MVDDCDMPKPRASVPSEDGNFATNVALVRKAAGLTYAQLAARVQICASSLWKLENGSRHATVGEAAVICKTLGVPLDTMVGTGLTAARQVTISV